MSSRPRKPEGRFITEGGRKLRTYLDLHGLGVVEFATKARVSRVTLAQVMDGQRWKHITVTFALRVQKATGGIIKVESFDQRTATDEAGKPAIKNGEEEEPPAVRRRTGTDG